VSSRTSQQNRNANQACVPSSSNVAAPIVMAAPAGRVEASRQSPIAMKQFHDRTVGGGVMQRIWSIGAAFIVFALASGSAKALDAAKAQAITRAADSYLSLAKDSARTGRVPRQTDATAKPLLDLVFDVSALQEPKPVESADIPHLSSWLGAVIKVGGVFLLAGTGASGNAVPKDPKARDIIDGNIGRFAQEIGRYVDAQTSIQAALIEAMTGLLWGAPREQLEQANVRDGVAQLRNGLAQSLSGILLMLANDGLSDEWRRARLPALASVAAKAAQFLLPEDVRALHDTALVVAGKMADPTVKAGLTLYAAAFTPRS